MLFAFVLRNRQIIFNTFQIVTICLDITGHRHFCVIHIMHPFGHPLDKLGGGYPFGLYGVPVNGAYLFVGE